MKRRTKRFILYGCLTLLLAVFGYSLYRYLSVQREYRAERVAHEHLLQYRPELPIREESSGSVSPSSSAGPTESLPVPDQTATPAETTPVTNSRIVQLKDDYPDAVGWITVPGTDVDYPFVQGKNNQYYLRRGIDGKYLYAGVPFLDYRCSADFSGENTILFGHNLRNGTMFGTLTRFKDRGFFEEHRYFYVFLEHDTICAEIIACLVVTPNQAPYVFEPEITSDFAERCMRDARQSAEGLAFSETDRFITLATCDYEKNNGRVILIGRIAESLNLLKETVPEGSAVIHP